MHYVKLLLESDPECGTNKSNEDNGVIEGTYLNMWCNINFSGDPAPVMKWSRNDGMEYEAALSNKNGKIFYAITMELSAEDNGKIYSCTTSFEPLSSVDAPQSRITRARNAPNYRYQWNLTAVVCHVTAASTNITIGPPNFTGKLCILRALTLIDSNISSFN